MCNFCCVSVAASETETHECRLQSVNKMERVGGEGGRWEAGEGGRTEIVKPFPTLRKKVDRGR